MVIRNRMPPWHENFKLPNGHVMLLRPIRPEDAAPLEAAISLMGPVPIRERFLASLPESSEQLGRQLTHPNPKHEIILVAAETLPPGEALIAAIARAALLPGTRHAQCTVLVSDFIAGQGIGRQLLRKLVKWARGKYLDRIDGEVHASNQQLIQLAQSLGFTVNPIAGTDDLLQLQLDLSR